MSPKIVISFFVGAGVGVAGSFFGFKKYFEMKTAQEIKEMRDYAHECQKYAKEMKKYADEMYESITGKKPPEEGFSKEEIIEYIAQNNLDKDYITTDPETGAVKFNRRREEAEIKSIEEEYDNIQDALTQSTLNNESYLNSLTDYTKYGKDPSAFEAPIEDVGVPRIELISSMEYDNSKPLNEKLMLSYYEDDDILCYEETAEIIQNPEELIGMEALHAFGSPDYEDPDEIFVRNNQRSEDYVITRFEGSYREVYGDY